MTQTLLALFAHPDDEALIQAVAASNPRTVVAMMGGSAIITENWRWQVPAILMLWYPGMEGGRAFARARYRATRYPPSPADEPARRAAYASAGGGARRRPGLRNRLRPL